MKLLTQLLLQLTQSRRMTRAAFTAALLASSLCLCVNAHAEPNYDKQLKQLKNVIQQVQQEMQAVKSERDQLLNALQNSETDIGELINQVDKIKADLHQKNQELKGLQQKQQQLELQQAEQKKHIEQQLTAAYKLGQQDRIKLLLNQEDPETLSRVLRYHDYILQARQEKVAEYLATLQELNSIVPQITQTRDQLNKDKNRLEQQYKALKTQQQERNQTLAKLNKMLQSKDQELKQQQANRQRLQKLLDSVRQAITELSAPDENQPFASRKGKLFWPVNGRMKQKFGSRRDDGKLKYEGVLLGAATGTEVKSIHYGRVLFANYLRGHGLLIIVDHGDNYMSLYGHNQSLSKEVGDWVTPGEVIATVGSSGGQQLSGLYFEIRHKGNPTNPSRWCKRLRKR